jgi:hypothetical protein
MAVTSTPPGIPSASRLAGRIGGKPGEPVEVTDNRLIAGGRSNPTYRLHVPGPGGTGCSCCAVRRVAVGCARRTGRDISRIGHYMAFGYVKLAVVLEGIHARYLQHQTVGRALSRRVKPSRRSSPAPTRYSTRTLDR